MNPKAGSPQNSCIAGQPEGGGLRELQPQGALTKCPWRGCFSMLCTHQGEWLEMMGADLPLRTLPQKDSNRSSGVCALLCLSVKGYALLQHVYTCMCISMYMYIYVCICMHLHQVIAFIGTVCKQGNHPLKKHVDLFAYLKRKRAFHWLSRKAMQTYGYASFNGVHRKRGRTETPM